MPTINAQLSADIALVTGQLANANAGLTALLALQIAPPTIAVSIANLGALLSALQAALSIGVPDLGVPPSVGLIASLNASIAALTAEVAAIGVITGNLGASGVFAWTYSGTGAAFGGTLTTALATTWPDSSPSSGAGNAIVLATRTPATWTSMLSIFGGL
jgi:hypothetical protein